MHARIYIHNQRPTARRSLHKLHPKWVDLRLSKVENEYKDTGRRQAVATSGCTLADSLVLAAVAPPVPAQPGSSALAYGYAKMPVSSNPVFLSA